MCMQVCYTKTPSLVPKYTPNCVLVCLNQQAVAESIKIPKLTKSYLDFWMHDESHDLSKVTSAGVDGCTSV
jgi:hypothetical protein